MTISAQPTATATSLGRVHVIDMATDNANPMLTLLTRHPNVLRIRFTANVTGYDVRTGNATDMRSIFARPSTMFEVWRAELFEHGCHKQKATRSRVALIIGFD